jgi:hypothetical protein
MPALGSRRSPSSFACSRHRRTTKRLLPHHPCSRFATEPTSGATDLAVRHVLWSGGLRDDSLTRGQFLDQHVPTATNFTREGSADLPPLWQSRHNNAVLVGNRRMTVDITSAKLVSSATCPSLPAPTESRT